MKMERRDFMKMGAGAFAIAAAGRAIGAGAPSNRVRVAIMGCHAKGRGKQLLATVMPYAEVATVCDVDSRALDFAADFVRNRPRHGGYVPKKEKDIRKVLEDKSIDAVIIASPDHWHAPAANMAMKAGKGVYVEKPCSYCPREGEILVKTQKETGAVFQMGIQRRSTVEFQAAIKDIGKGCIGRPYWAKCWYMCSRGSVRRKPLQVPDWLDWDLWQGPAPRREFHSDIVHYNWHWWKHWGTGECGNNATHFVDIGRWALGAEYPERVTCGGGLYCDRGDFEWFDVQNISCEFPGRKMVTWEGVSSTGIKPFMDWVTGCIVYGTEGAVVFGPGNQCYQLSDRGITREERRKGISSKIVKEWSRESMLASSGQLSFTNPTGELDKGHMGNFIDAVRAKMTNTAAPADVSHKSTLLTHLGNVALRTGETIRIDPATGQLAKGSAGAEFWSREYEKGWEMV